MLLYTPSELIDASVAIQQLGYECMLPLLILENDDNEEIDLQSKLIFIFIKFLFKDMKLFRAWVHVPQACFLPLFPHMNP
jgi:hypothetical protein